MYKYFTQTSWEYSYYGGVKRILTEYPYIPSSYDVVIEAGESTQMHHDLSKYQQEKMISIMLMTCFQDEGHKHLFVNTMATLYASMFLNPGTLAKYIQRDFFTRREKVRVDVPKPILMSILRLCKENSELNPIFSEYETSLIDQSTKFYVLLDLPGEQPSMGSGDGESEQEESSDVHQEGKSQLFKLANKYKPKNNIEDWAVKVTEVSESDEPAQISEKEILFAKKMFNLLDITQDPKSDIMKNLYQGKLDPEKLSEVLAGNNKVYMRKVEHESVKPFKVVILADYSGSMNYGNRLKFQAQMLKSMYYLFNDLLNVKDLEIWGHSGEDDPTLYKLHTPEYPKFLDTIGSHISTEENYDGPVIQELHRLVRAKSDKAVLFISLSDGQPAGNNYGGKDAINKMKQIMEKAKRDNFVTVGIGIQYFSEEGLYHYSTVINDLKNPHSVAQVINKAVKENLLIEG